MFSKFDEDSQKVLLMAKKEMMDLKHPYVGSEHLLLAILHNTDLAITQVLSEYKITYKKTIQNPCYDRDYIHGLVVIGTDSVSGPASKFMDALGIEVSSLGVASLYESFLDTIVIDKKDNNLKDDLEKIVSEVIVTNTIMKNLDDKKKLAKIILNDIS